MSLYIDKKYINLISNQLEKFKWKGDGLANCRCKICGDSTTNKNKARGYFFHNNDTYFYKCHNCGVSLNLYSFLENLSPVLAHEYNFETFKDTKEAEEIITYKPEIKLCEGLEVQKIHSLPSSHKVRMYLETRKIPRKFWDSLGYTDDFGEIAYNFETFKDTKEAEEIITYKPEVKLCEGLEVQKIHSLPSSHKVRMYLETRKIPRKFWDSLGYTDDFGEIAYNFDESYKDKFAKEERLIIKIQNKNGVCGIQGRSLEKNPKVKYITLKKNVENCYFNFNNVDIGQQFFITEGPFDSMFLKNAFATLGLSKMRNLEKEIDDTNGVYILDNEPHNQDVVSLMDHLIAQNKKVCIFPKTVRKKDINDMVLANLDIYGIIMNNIYDGLRARLVFNKWRKI